MADDMLYMGPTTYRRTGGQYGSIEGLPFTGVTEVSYPFGFREAFSQAQPDGTVITIPAMQHNGIDLPQWLQTPILAPCDLVFLRTETTEGGGNVGQWTAANGHFLIRLGHLLELPGWEIGRQFKRGEVIALVGNTGKWTTGPHLHFEVWEHVDGIWIARNPLDYFWPQGEPVTPPDLTAQQVATLLQRFPNAPVTFVPKGPALLSGGMTYYVSVPYDARTGEWADGVIGGSV